MKQRAAIIIKGAVQGIGFRPFIYRLASALDIKGYINNTTAGVFIEAEGEKEILIDFLRRVQKEKPGHSLIKEIDISLLEPKNYTSFQILTNCFDGEPDTIILPDLGICSDCLKELFNPADRRYLYPFINCTNCGPRFSIIKSIPYDRCNTTMDEFDMCEDCREEYLNPLDRRFHAEPIACHLCGPNIALWNPSGNIIVKGNESIKETARFILSGKIAAVKGLGGFHLIADASSESIIKELRKRKYRDGKPFALMFSSISQVMNYCHVSPAEEKLLLSAEAPIVLLKSKGKLPDSIAPGNPYLGVMLPYTPLHHLLMNELKMPAIATSGNISDEPMCTDECAALEKLKGIADIFLVHNRKILRPVDDSIVRIALDTPVIIRRSRGYAPLPFDCDTSGNPMIALGAHLKNSVALKKNNYIFMSHQLGDLSTREAVMNFDKTIEDLKELYNIHNIKYISDLHPDYYSSKYRDNTDAHFRVQHHISHVASCYGENKLSGEVLGIAWDGTGLGLDNSIWGSEFFIYDGVEAIHSAQLLNYSIPGGEIGIKNLINSAAAVLSKALTEKEVELLPEEYFYGRNPRIIFEAVRKNINCYRTSSMGRLFDAVSYILGLCEKVTYEGEGAMMLEYCAFNNCADTYSFKVCKDSILFLDWRPVIREIINDIKASIPAGVISAKFHNSLIDMIIYAAEYFAIENIVLSGGCFQNLYLLENAVRKLRSKGFNPYWNMKIPFNDSGISYGQIVYTMNRLYGNKLKKEKKEIEYVSGCTG